MRISSILAPSGVLLGLTGPSKRDVLARLAEPIVAARSCLDRSVLVEELVRREEQSSTAIADGIAIPHARCEQGEHVTASFGVAADGVDFDSLDGKPTRLVMVVVSPPSSPDLHVRWIAHVARVLDDPGTRERLLRATDPAEVLATLDAREDAIEAEDAAASAARGAHR